MKLTRKNIDLLLFPVKAAMIGTAVGYSIGYAIVYGGTFGYLASIALAALGAGYFLVRKMGDK